MRPAVRIIFGCFRQQRGKAIVEGAIMQGQPRTVYLDPRSSNLGRVFVHEMIHIKHPSWCERAVITETKKVWDKMSWKEKARIYQLFGTAKIENEDG